MAKHAESGKIVIVGDGACGKTCMLEVFKENEFPEDYVPTVVDNFVKDVELEYGKYFKMAIWDTAGQEDYDTIRPLAYNKTQLVLICYSVENKEYLPNISDKWLVEIKNQCPNAQYYLVGLKKDLRDDFFKNDKEGLLTDFEKKNSNFVTNEEGEDLAKKIKANKFFECSAKTNDNISNIFLSAAEDISLSYAPETSDKEQVKCCGCLGRNKI